MAVRVLLKRPLAAYCLASFANRFVSTNPFKTQNFSYSNSLKFSSLSFSQARYRKQISLASVLQRFGFPSSDLPAFLSKNRFLLDGEVSDVEKSLGTLLFMFKLPQNMLVHLVTGCPGVLNVNFLKEWEASVLGLKVFRDSPAAIARVVEFSRRFQRGPREFVQYIHILKSLEFTDGTISRILREYPEVVTVEEHELQKHMAILATLGLERGEIDTICFFFPRLLGIRVEDRMKPLLNELSQMGFGRRLLRQEIIYEPRILSLDLGELQRYLDLLKRLSCRTLIKEKIIADGELRAGFAVKLRVDLFCKYGLIHRDAFNLLKREPRVILYDIEDIEKKIDFLLQRMRFDISCLIDVPHYLGMNFEKQIVPRYNVIEYLRSRGELGFKVGLGDIVRRSRLVFYNMFVEPYPECEKIYGRYSDNSEAKRRHPPGLWKLFKPPASTRSNRDIESIRSFMEM